MKKNFRLDYMNASNLTIKALSLGIPKGLIRIVLRLSNEGYDLGRKASLDNKDPFVDSYGKANENATRYLNEDQIQQLSYQSKINGIPENLVPATLRVIESAYLLGFADQFFGLPENNLGYCLRLNLLTRIAYKKKVATQ